MVLHHAAVLVDDMGDSRLDTTRACLQGPHGRV